MEWQCVETFLHWYNSENGLSYRVEMQRERPDIFLKTTDGTRRLGVEITLAIPDDQTAKVPFARNEVIITEEDLKPENRSAAIRKMSPVHASSDYAPVIRKCIQVKCQKALQYDLSIPLILVVGFSHLTFDKRSVEGYVLPELEGLCGEPFREIWINCFNCAREAGIVRVL